MPSFDVSKSASLSRNSMNSSLFASVTALDDPPSTRSRLRTAPNADSSTENVSSRPPTSMSRSCDSDFSSVSSSHPRSTRLSGSPQTCFNKQRFRCASRCAPSNSALPTNFPAKLSHRAPPSTAAATAASSLTKKKVRPASAAPRETRTVSRASAASAAAWTVPRDFTLPWRGRPRALHDGCHLSMPTATTSSSDLKPKPQIVHVGTFASTTASSSSPMASRTPSTSPSTATSRAPALVFTAATTWPRRSSASRDAQGAHRRRDVDDELARSATPPQRPHVKHPRWNVRSQNASRGAFALIDLLQAGHRGRAGPSRIFASAAAFAGGRAAGALDDFWRRGVGAAFSLSLEPKSHENHDFFFSSFAGASRRLTLFSCTRWNSSVMLFTRANKS
mmetsp:Transcript_20582/g.67990  ORF Transcript_20582/g.67990 Transcript_20582/m.67990 type:complete len:392 (+) Transcript_20582:165-1340(+)